MSSKKEKKKAKQEKLQKELERQKKLKALLDTANQAQDVLVDFAPFKKFDRNGVDLEIQYFTKITDETLLNWMFNLTKKNMQELYEKCEWGWSDSKKKSEFSHEDARFLVAFDKSSRNPVGFVHFRFECEDREVIYCWEIQVELELQSKGLGKFLMQILELVARKYGMKWIMLTCFTYNQRAIKFYVEKLKYSPDIKSPNRNSLEGSSFEILSKQLVSP